MNSKQNTVDRNQKAKTSISQSLWKTFIETLNTKGVVILTNSQGKRITPYYQPKGNILPAGIVMPGVVPIYRAATRQERKRLTKGPIGVRTQPIEMKAYTPADRNFIGEHAYIINPIDARKGYVEGQVIDQADDAFSVHFLSQTWVVDTVYLETKIQKNARK